MKTSSKSILVLTVLALATGCGGDPKKTTPVNHALPVNKTTQKIDPKTGKPIPSSTAPTAQQTAADQQRQQALAKQSAQLKDVDDAVNQLLSSGTPITKENMTPGDYVLDSVVTSFKYLNGNDVLDAIHSNSVQLSGSQIQLVESQATKFGGSTIQPVDYNGRQLDLPYKFTVDSAKWQPNRDSASNVVLNTQVRQANSSGSGAISSGYAINDFFQSANGSLKASVMNILAGAQLSLDRTNSSDNTAYPIKDESGVLVTLHLYQQSNTSMLIHVEFDEQVADSSSKLKATSAVSVTRNVFLIYKVNPKPGAQAQQQQQQQQAQQQQQQQTQQQQTQQNQEQQQQQQQQQQTQQNQEQQTQQQQTQQNQEQEQQQQQQQGQEQTNQQQQGQSGYSPMDVQINQ